VKFCATRVLPLLDDLEFGKYCIAVKLWDADCCVAGSPVMPAHLDMFNHVEAASVLCETTSVTSDASSSVDDRDTTVSQDIAHDLGVTPLVSS